MLSKNIFNLLELQIKKENGFLSKIENSVFKYFPHDKKKKCDDFFLCIFINSLWDSNDSKCLVEIYLKIKKKFSKCSNIKTLSYHISIFKRSRKSTDFFYLPVVGSDTGQLNP